MLISQVGIEGPLSTAWLSVKLIAIDEFVVMWVRRKFGWQNGADATVARGEVRK
jgi:hypothetical protein